MRLSAKRLGLLVVLLLLVGASFLFRNTISELLTFGSAPPPPPQLADDLLLREEVRAPSAPAPSVPQSSEEVPSSPPPTAPRVSVYTGRDPTEVRPVPEEVKLFTEDQKQQLYATLQTHGRAVKADPEYFNGWIQVGILKKTIGDFIGSRDAWEYAGVIQPLNSLSFSNLGELYWRYLHEYPQSEKNFRTSIKNKPSDTQNYISLAELYHYSYVEKKERADDVLLEGTAANPLLEEPLRYEALARRLAYLYEQRKEYDKALEWWQKVLELRPADEEVKKSIERVQGR